MLKAVIFDMDGVLINSEPIHFQAHKILMERLNINFDVDYYMQFVGTTTDYMWTKIIEDFNLNYSKEELMEMSNNIVKGINGKKGYPVIPGARELIVELSKTNLMLALASSSGMERIQNVIKCMQVEGLFDEIVSGIDVDNPKPAPDTFLQAAKQLNVEPSQCIVIEDSTNGIKAAKAASMACVAFENVLDLSFVNRQDTSGADYVVQSMESIDADFLEMVYSHAMKEP